MNSPRVLSGHVGYPPRDEDPDRGAWRFPPNHRGRDRIGAPVVLWKLEHDIPQQPLHDAAEPPNSAPGSFGLPGNLADGIVRKPQDLASWVRKSFLYCFSNAFCGSVRMRHSLSWSSSSTWLMTVKRPTNSGIMPNCCRSSGVTGRAGCRGLPQGLHRALSHQSRSAGARATGNYVF